MPRIRLGLEFDFFSLGQFTEDTFCLSRADVELGRKLVKKVAMISAGLTDPFEEHPKIAIGNWQCLALAGRNVAGRFGQ